MKGIKPCQTKVIWKIYAKYFDHQTGEVGKEEKRIGLGEMLENHMTGKSGSNAYKLECFLHLVDYALINGLQEKM